MKFLVLLFAVNFLLVLCKLIWYWCCESVADLFCSLVLICLLCLLVGLFLLCCCIFAR